MALTDSNESKPWDPEFIEARKALINAAGAGEPHSFGFTIAWDGTVTVTQDGVERIAEGAEAEQFRGILGDFGRPFEPEPAAGLRWWWMSFADPDRPTGSQFLGVAIVQAEDLAGAVTESHLRGINPGGQISAVEIPEDHVPAEEFRNRLLSREEAETL